MSSENEEIKKYIISFKSDIELLKTINNNVPYQIQQIDAIEIDDINEKEESKNIKENNDFIGVIFKKMNWK